MIKMTPKDWKKSKIKKKEKQIIMKVKDINIALPSQIGYLQRNGAYNRDSNWR